MLDGTEFFECECGSDEHTLRFILDLDKTPGKDYIGNQMPRLPELYVSVFLQEKPWYVRFWAG